MRPAVFLDRDGTLIEEFGYLTPASQLQVYPWSIDAVRLLNRAGFAVVVVTNQGGIARGHFTADFVNDTHRGLGGRFAAGGAHIDAWQYCPHHPEAIDDALRAPCMCRKPATGMVEAAARALGGLDLAASWVVGDQWRDVQLGHAIGARSILVRTGHGRLQETTWPEDLAPPSAVCDHLMAAAAVVIRAANTTSRTP